jgi:hypothetical protein
MITSEKEKANLCAMRPERPLVGTKPPSRTGKRETLYIGMEATTCQDVFTRGVGRPNDALGRREFPSTAEPAENAEGILATEVERHREGYGL